MEIVDLKTELNNMLTLFRSAILSITLALVFSTPLFASQADNAESAREIIRMLDKGKYTEVISRFDSTMTKAAPEEKLRTIWTSLINQTGKLQEELSDTTIQYNGYEIVLVTCKFEKTVLDVKVIFDKESKIAGLFFAPHREIATGPETNSSNTTEQSGSADSLHEGAQPGNHKAEYISKDVTFENKKANVTLAGTLTIPDSKGTFPAVLLIPGSGPHDRDEAILGHKIFLVLADYLTRHGIAVLRVDKRGIGKSTGDYAATTTMDFASDALAGVNYLLTVKQVNHRKIGLIGHSEGGIIAPIVADESPNVAFVVLLGGPGVSGYKIILSQLAAIDRASGVSDSSVNAALAVEKKLLHIVMTEKDSAKAAGGLRRVLETELKQTSGEADANISQLLSPWYRSFLAYDPVPALRKLKCPVLAVWGSKDLQVPPAENMPAVEKALKSGRNKDFNVVEISGLNHLFQDAKTGSPLEYGSVKESISPRALEVITKWILKETRSNGR